MSKLFKQNPPMENNDVNLALSDIFEAAGVQPNTVPIHTLMKRRHRIIGLLRISRVVAIISLLAILLSPVAFKQASRELKKPVIDYSYREAGRLWIQLTEDTKGVDFSECYALTENGALLKAVVSDEKSNMLAFEAAEPSLNIYIVNYGGNVTHAVYTSFDEK